MATGIRDLRDLADTVGTGVQDHAASVVLAIAALGLYAFGHWNDIERWFGIQNDRTLSERVRRFLEDFHYSVERVEPDDDDNVVFNWSAEKVARDGDERLIDHGFSVFKVKNLPEAIVFGVRLQLDEETRKAIVSRQGAVRSRAYAAIQADIAGSGAHYRMIGADHKPVPRNTGFEAVREIFLEELVFVTDGLSTEEFLDGIQRLRSATVVASQALARELNSGIPIVLPSMTAQPPPAQRRGRRGRAS